MTKNEELLKLVGFKIGGVYWSPEGKHTPLKDLPDLFHDLNALDKWVVPVLRERRINTIHYSFTPIGNVTCVIAGYNVSSLGMEISQSAALASAALKFLKGE
jgi:hypothetical protein